MGRGCLARKGRSAKPSLRIPHRSGPRKWKSAIFEEFFKNCETLADKPLDERLEVAVIIHITVIDLCVKDMKDRLELAAKDMRHPEEGEEIISSVGRQRDMFGGSRPMGADNNETDHPDHHPYWWGGAGTHWLDVSENWWLHWADEGSPEESQMQSLCREGSKGIWRTRKGARLGKSS